MKVERRSEGNRKTNKKSMIVVGKKKTEDTFNLKFLHNDEKTINLNLKTCLLPPNLVFSPKNYLSLNNKKKQTLNKRFWHRRTYVQTVGWPAGRRDRRTNWFCILFFVLFSFFCSGLFGEEFFVCLVGDSCERVGYCICQITNFLISNSIHGNHWF